MHKVMMGTEKNKNDRASDSSTPMRVTESEYPPLPSSVPTRQLIKESQKTNAWPLASRRAPGFTITDSTTKMALPIISSDDMKPVAQNNTPALSNIQHREGHTVSRTFTTILITDSILRHVKTKDSLGNNHELIQINKRDSRGLNDADLRKRVQEIRPDYVYVHLGVNDVYQDIPMIDTLKNFMLCNYQGPICYLF